MTRIPTRIFDTQLRKDWMVLRAGVHAVLASQIFITSRVLRFCHTKKSQLSEAFFSALQFDC